MEDQEREVLAEVERQSEELVEVCRTLVRINTVNPYSGDANAGLERDGQVVLEPMLREMGATTRLFEPPEGIYEKMDVLGPKERVFKDRPNLIGEFKFGEGGRRIVINGHMDTVAASGMTFDPFCAKVEDGRILGRGTSDCKGGLSVGLMAIKALLPFQADLTGSIVYESVVDEECNGSGAGTLACCYEGYRGDAAIVVDGNDLHTTIGCGGCLTADVTVMGREAHAASGEGVNAIDKALIAKRAVDRFKEKREAQYPEARVNLGIFHAGVHPAVVPGKARLSLNIVYELEEAMKAQAEGEGWGGVQIRRAFEEAIRSAEASDPWLREHLSDITWVKDLIPFETPRDAEIVQTLKGTFEATLGRKPEVNTIAAWADAAYIPRFANTPTVLFGPGLGNKCHTPDEYVEIQDLVDATKVLALYLYRQLKK